VLNRVKLLRELESVSDKLFLDLSEQSKKAQDIWRQICADPLFLDKIKASVSPWSLPLWEGDLGEIFSIEPQTNPYQIVSVDGSQIYPDKHQGIGCFLINVGSVVLQYGTTEGKTFFGSEPHLFVEHDQLFDSEKINPIDLVNGIREEFEFSSGYDLMSLLKKNHSEYQSVFLCDGSLIFWHLESKDRTIKDYFLKKYCEILKKFESDKMPMAGYISLPKSKDLLNLVRVALCNFNMKSDAHEIVRHLVDSSIVRSYVPEGYRTTLFQSQSPITEEYPESIRPYFFYINTGVEIGRVEIPAYVAHDKQLLDLVCKLIMDQTKKGRGYPVVIAEAHEQAVVKGSDREFFYRLIAKMSIDLNKKVLPSQKATRKRIVTV
jgi:hypothetical protein